jgi:hypothetical protein
MAVVKVKSVAKSFLYSSECSNRFAEPKKIRNFQGLYAGYCAINTPEACFKKQDLFVFFDGGLFDQDRIFIPKSEIHV